MFSKAQNTRKLSSQVCYLISYFLSFVIDKYSNNAKLIILEHNKHPVHAILKDWDKTDIERLLRKLVIEDYLCVSEI